MYVCRSTTTGIGGKHGRGRGHGPARMLLRMSNSDKLPREDRCLCECKLYIVDRVAA